MWNRIVCSTLRAGYSAKAAEWMTEEDLRGLVVAAGDARERSRRERLLALVEGAGTADPFDLAKYVLQCTRAEQPVGPPDR